MKEKNNLFDFCKKAKVKLPLNLIGKRISFSYIDKDNITVKKFSKIVQIALVNDEKVYIYLATYRSYNHSTVALSYEDGWKYCVFNNKGVIESSTSIENIIFEKKWWQI